MLTNASTAHSGCRPRLFVHYLPEGYRDPNDRIGRGVGSTVLVDLQDWPAGVHMSNSQQYQLGDLFYERALGYRCRTHEPTHADLFFVPAFSGSLAQAQKAEPDAASSPDAMFDRLHAVKTANGRSVLEARGGADHILLQARIGAGFESTPFAELSYRDARLGSATRLSMEEWAASWAQALPWPGYHAEAELYHSVPFNSAVHLTHTARGVPWAHLRERERRTPLVAASFMLGVHTPTGGGLLVDGSVRALRAQLHKSCTAQAAHCEFLFPEARDAQVGEQRFSQILSLYWRATFCLMPAGDAATRKGTVDALLLGCIPVHFHEAQTRQWPWHWGDWHSNASVYLEHERVMTGELDAIDALRAIPPADVARMRDVISAHAHRMQYSAIDTAFLREGLLPVDEGDAFDVAIAGAWRASRATGAVRSGRRKQQLASRVRHAGFCNTTDVGGDCASGAQGAWQMRAEQTEHIDTLRAACLKLCDECERCRFASYSSRWRDCSWFHACDLSNLHSEIRGFETVQLGQVGGASFTSKGA